MKIFLTLDYELYGDGSGHVFHNIIEPMESLLLLAKELDIKYTIFFEYLEYLKLKEEWSLGNKMGYVSDPSVAMAEQIKKALLLGHSVQLHIHPQWLNAKYKNDDWILDNSLWRLGSLNKKDLTAVLTKGKETLESLLISAKHDYKCIALRAGGYNCQPSEEILQAMKQVGLEIDSSIYAGGYEDGLLSKYDFRTISTATDFWECGDNLESFGENKIFELPITSYPIRRLYKYTSFSRLISILKNRKSAVTSFKSKTTDNNSFIRKIKYFIQRECITWDFCLFSERMNKLFYREAKSENKKVCVLVGHPKGFTSIKSTHKIIKYLKDKDCQFDIIRNSSFNKINL